MKQDVLEVYRAADGFRWRLRSHNGRIIASGEAYTRRHDAMRGGVRACPSAGAVYGIGRRGAGTLEAFGRLMRDRAKIARRLLKRRKF